MLSADVTLPGVTSSVPTARRFVESVLTSWGHAELGWSAAVCISELAANAALHARTAFTVRVALDAGAVRLEISDGSARLPVARDYGTAATTGRGLRLLDEYAESWGVDLVDGGKTVWVVLRLEDAGGGEDDEAEASVEDLLARFDDGGEDLRTTSVRTVLRAA